jgi:hypothetical protein
MKQTVKAVVLAVTTDQPLYVCEAIALSPCPQLDSASLGKRLRRGLIYIKLKMY